MVSGSHLVAFVLVSVALIIVPGPSVLFVIGRALVLGRRGALLTVLGNAIGVFVQVVAVAFGVGALVAASATAFTVIKLAGAAYLVFLGIQAIRHRTEHVAPQTHDAAPTATPAILREGFLVGLLNPKTIVFFAAVLPQFIEKRLGPPSAQMLMLGALFVALALMLDGSWALVASGARAWFARSPHRIPRLRATGGVMMVGLGAVLAATRRAT